MRDLKDLGTLLLGFMPWLLFLFLSGHTLASLEYAIIISLVASLTFGFSELRRGYILQWGTLLFFCLCVILINLLKVIWVATHMDLLANATLTCIMWLSIVVGKPFALQYAQRDLPREAWGDPKVIKGCLFITLVWACLMTLSVLVSLVHRSSVVHVPEWIYFYVTLCIILTGLIFTVLFKRQKRLQRERAGTGG
ncbi:MAG: hypothetical protein NTX36_06985 [Proteobacteria bacterium]|nr:hypothetical protein [Pseudomonadota bacterium]